MTSVTEITETLHLQQIIEKAMQKPIEEDVSGMYLKFFHHDYDFSHSMLP